MLGVQKYLSTIPNIVSQSSRVSVVSLRGQSNLSKPTENTKAETKSKILYDGECKICQVEISLLKRLPSKKNIEYVDITSVNYNPAMYNGITYKDAMKEMHVIADNKVYVKADAIRKMYEVVGLNWLANFTRLPVIAPYCDKLYVRFAKYRLNRALKTCDTDKCSIKLKQLKEESER